MSHNYFNFSSFIEHFVHKLFLRRKLLLPDLLEYQFVNISTSEQICVHQHTHTCKRVCVEQTHELANRTATEKSTQKPFGNYNIHIYVNKFESAQNMATAISQCSKK